MAARRKSTKRASARRAPARKRATRRSPMPMRGCTCC